MYAPEYSNCMMCPSKGPILKSFTSTKYVHMKQIRNFESLNILYSTIYSKWIESKF